jgi:hypothetical protein
MINPTTTLAKIRAHSPCDGGYKKLCKSLGGIRKYGANTPITVRQIVESNGLADALWCLRTMPEHSNRWRRLAVRYARSVQRLMTDPRSLAALDVAERHATGLATDGELKAAADAAWAARAAAWAAGAAAWAADAAAEAAGAAAEAAAWDAAEAAADAARDAARAAAVAEQTKMLIDICEAENEK